MKVLDGDERMKKSKKEKRKTKGKKERVGKQTGQMYYVPWEF